MLGGIVLCLAASPPVAARIGLDPFHFVNRQVLFLIPAGAVLIGTSFLSPRDIRKVALVVFIVSLMLTAADAPFRRRDQRRAALAGHSRRQYPAVGVSQARFRDPDRLAVRRNRRSGRKCRPTDRAGFALIVVALLVLQPDFGQTMLISLVWGALFYMAGMRLIWVIGLAATASAGLVTAFFTVPHVAQRINRFLDPSFGRHLQRRYRHRILHPRRLVRPRSGRRHHQADFARRPHRLRLRGGGRRIRRRALPHSGRAVRFHCDPRADQGDAHRRSVRPFRRGGLAILFGLQSAINMAVNLHLMPAKGMTLPFISYGGSSLISLAYGMGMLVALTRERPRAKLDGDLLLAGDTVAIRRDGGAGPGSGAGAGRRHGRAFVSGGSAGGGPGKRGIPVHLATDHRAARFGGAFSEQNVHVVTALRCAPATRSR